MSVGLSSSQRTYFALINQILVDHPKWTYLDPAWGLTFVEIESGGDPTVKASDYATTGSIGLMQVTSATAAQMASAYGIPKGPQTDPMLSLQSGYAYLDYSARDIIKKRNVKSLPLWDLIEAYNEGYGGEEAGRHVPRYLAEFQAALKIIEAQMEATASTRYAPSFAPRLVRAAMPLIAGEL